MRCPYNVIVRSHAYIKKYRSYAAWNTDVASLPCADAHGYKDAGATRLNFNYELRNNVGRFSIINY
ncbi:hypothetical protein FACS189435_3550 [Bacteroidia bacterium]|nr:hypothetical protein FACS189435_3550 [Bacteroidia bacterium]